MDHIQELSRRLEVVETRYRRMRNIVLLCLISASAVMLMGQRDRLLILGPETGNAQKQPQPSHETKITAESFVLVDAKGNERASLVTDGSGSVFFVLFDANGKPRADIQVSSYGPSLNFYDPNAKPRLVMGSTTIVGSHVANNGILEKNPPSSIVMFDQTGKLLWRTP